jgi:hypothetical protein
MPQKAAQSSTVDSAASDPRTPDLKSLPAVELLSFLKQTRRVQTWTEKDLAKALKIGVSQAKQAIAVLQLQGYIEPAGTTAKWRITEQGDQVAGAKPPRFTRQSVEHALNELRVRIQEVNEDTTVDYTITDAVAFGDFLGDAVRVQAAEVGIRLTPKRKEQLTASAKSTGQNWRSLNGCAGKRRF